MSMFNFVKTSHVDKNVKENPAIAIDKENEKLRKKLGELNKKLAERNKELYRKEKELQKIHMSLARW